MALAADPGDGPDIIRCRSRDFIWEHMPFQEWLLWKYNYTPRQLYELCLATGRYGDYNNVMEWYRRRYRQYNEQREQLRTACPFTDNND